MTPKVLILLTCLMAVNSSDFSSDEYIKLSANKKMDRLWSEISHDQTSFGWYNIAQVGMLMMSDLKPTFEAKGDILPEGRKKLIHTVGSIAQAKWISTGNHPYIGVFQGASNFLIRYSIATMPSRLSGNEPAGADFAPGISLKFLRDGIDSANLVAMFSPSGQPSWNPFAFDFTNYFQLNKVKMDKMPILAKFATFTNYASAVGVKGMAEHTHDGKTVLKPRYPFQLIFRPTKNVKSRFPDYYSEDFTDQLATIPAGTPLYDVYALDEPNCPEVKIATIVITTDFIKSKFCDEKLFFRHSCIEDDDQGKAWSDFRDYFSLIFGVNTAPIPEKKSACPFAKLLR